MFLYLLRFFRGKWAFYDILRRFFVKEDENSCQPSYIRKLPVEILLLIQDHLELDSAISFSLASRDLLQSLSYTPLNSLRLPENADWRKKLLLTLQRDLSDWQYCHPCSVFHPYDKEIGVSTKWRWGDEPKCVKVCGFVCVAGDYNLRYQHAQWIMNRYQAGRLQQQDLEMFSYDRALGYDGIKVQNVINVLVEYGGLSIRATSTLRLERSLDADTIKNWLLMVCPHLARNMDSYKYELLVAPIRCQLMNGPEACPEWRYCPICWTAFLVQIWKRPYGIEIRLIIRKFLGSCKSPFDPSWTMHHSGIPVLVSRTKAVEC